MNNLGDGLTIVGVGILGVFVNRVVLMAVVYVLGAIFGKKKKKKKNKAKKAKKAAEIAPVATDAEVATPSDETAPAS